MTRSAANAHVGWAALDDKTEKMPYHFTAIQAAEVLRMWEAGEAVRDIAKMVGTSMHHVYWAVNRMRREGKTTVSRARRVAPEVKLAVADDYAAGLPLDAIAKKHSVCVGSIRPWAAQLGKKKGGSTAAVLKKRASDACQNRYGDWIIRMVSKGWTQSAVAVVVGLSKSRIQQLCAAANLPRRGKAQACASNQCPHCGGDLTIAGLGQPISKGT